VLAAQGSRAGLPRTRGGSRWVATHLGGRAESTRTSRVAIDSKSNAARVVALSRFKLVLEAEGAALSGRGCVR
jgi:hypothetical protein